MVVSLPGRIRIFVATGATDMRKAFDGLCAIVEHQFHRDPYEGDLFAFFNRRRNHTTFSIPIADRRRRLPMAPTVRSRATAVSPREGRRPRAPAHRCAGWLLEGGSGMDV
jgi:hypothetical protein